MHIKMHKYIYIYKFAYVSSQTLMLQLVLNNKSL